MPVPSVSACRLEVQLRVVTRAVEVADDGAEQLVGGPLLVGSLADEVAGAGVVGDASSSWLGGSFYAA